MAIEPVADRGTRPCGRPPRRPRRAGLVAIFAALLLAAPALPATAETIPPGDYGDTGRVVRTARGSVELFDGHGCMLLLNDTLQQELEPHLGEIVRVDYTRVEATPEMLLDSSGSPIGKIRKITRLAQDVGSQPLAISVRPASDDVPVGEPVRVEVTLRNATDAPVTVDADQGECNLLVDYRWVLSLHPEDRGVRPRVAARKELASGEAWTFTLTSAWMADTGTYDVVFVLPGNDVYPDSGRAFAYQSDAARVSVRAPVDEAEELVALRAWLTRAVPTQRIEIAEKLLAKGDDSGVDVVFQLFLDRAEWGSTTYSPAFRFLWRHGGERGEKAMLGELDALTEQRRALRVIEEVHNSPRAVVLLERLLADERETTRASSGWCDRPRICDITAAWLVGYTDGEMTFPHAGTIPARDAAVKQILEALRDDPAPFSVLE